MTSVSPRFSKGAQASLPVNGKPPGRNIRHPFSDHRQEARAPLAPNVVCRFVLKTWLLSARVGSMQLRIEIEQEGDGRWIAEVPSLPGCLSYGVTREDAVRSAEALALRILADRCELGDDSVAREAFAVSA